MKTICLLFIISLYTFGLVAEQPNVIIFYTDDQGTLDTGAYGSKDLYTPNMDILAAEGVRFTQAYAHVVCCPSRAMMMTGRYPQRSGIVGWTQGDRNGKEKINLPKSEVTIAEVLKTKGYKTGLFGKWHLGAKDGHGPIDQGFDEFYGHLGGFIDNYNHHFLHGGGFHDLYDQKKEVFEREQYFPDLMTKRAVEFLDKHKESPFFMLVSFNIPHYPEQADAKFDERYKDLPMPRQSYAKMISTTDDRMGVIMKRLAEHGLSENTMIIFMSDNGHSSESNQGIKVDNHTSGLPKGHYYSAHGGGGYTGKWIGNKGGFTEGGIRVPAIIRYPYKFKAGLVRDQAITACDLMPTIMDLCEVKKPTDLILDGRSLVPMIQENALSHHNVMHWGWQERWMVRRGDWKLISQGKSLQLFNLTGDQPEKVNFVKDKPELVHELRQLHEAWISSVTKKTEKE